MGNFFKISNESFALRREIHTYSLFNLIESTGHRFFYRFWISFCLYTEKGRATPRTISVDIGLQK